MKVLQSPISFERGRTMSRVVGIVILLGITCIGPGAILAADSVYQFRSIEAERVTVMEGGGYFPSAVLLQNGDLIVVGRGGGRHHFTRGAGLMLARSHDLGKTWSRPTWIVGGRHTQDIRDGCLTQLKDGTLILGFLVIEFEADNVPNQDNVPAYVTRSKDNGYTWEVPVRVDVSPFTFGSPVGPIIELPSGTLLMSVITTYTQEGLAGNIWRSPEERGFFGYVFRSRDGGKTWGDRSLIGKHWDDETHMLRLPSGRLLAAIRTAALDARFTAGVMMSESSDEGRTWHDLGEVTEPGVNSPGHLLRLRDGRILLTYGDRARPFLGVEAMVSRDEGRTWDRDDRFQLVWDAPTVDVGYPSSIQLSDGRIFTVYYTVDDLAKAPASAKAAAVIWRIPD